MVNFKRIKKRSSVLVLILPFENGDLQIKKRSLVTPVVFGSAGVERDCERKDVVFGWFVLRFPLQVLSIEKKNIWLYFVSVLGGQFILTR